MLLCSNISNELTDAHNKKAIENLDRKQLYSLAFFVHQNNDDLVPGYTKDDEGIINNYAQEPAISTATYPTRQQQFRYLFLGAGAIIFVATLLLIAFAVS